MIYQLLGKLFSSGYLDRYTPHPSHTVWALFIMAIGTYTFTVDGWVLFGTISFILGAGLGVSTIVGMIWEKSIEYWSTVNEFAKTMIKSNNPDLWQALGFKHVPQNVTVTEVKQADNESGFSMKFHRLPISPAVMQSIADKVLMSGNTDFIEANYHNIPNFRKVHKELKANGLLSPKNKKNVRIGYTFNRKGMDTLYEYASESIKLELRKKENR